ncbi:peptidase M1 [Pendulispora rubella]|uniref:Peptidase M1 n=1 Tax=Pendulispora rubella TaxID=2741070 RepID=A0ABZ2L5H2_9BACT
MRWYVLACLAFSAAGCDVGAPEVEGESSRAALDDAAPVENWDYDLRETSLSLDVSNLTATAIIEIGPNLRGSASFEIGDLEIRSVRGRRGPLAYVAEGKKLHVKVPRSSLPASFEVAYAFKPHTQFDGWDPGTGLTFLWPYFCGNLFPCKSSPADGVEFRMKVTGAPEGKKVIYPSHIPNDAPSYMPAVAVGDFTEVDLGRTLFGTQVKAWHLPGQEAVTAQGTAHLRGVFEFYEKTYGRYTFGNVVGSVSANWGPGAYGGMEHHPYWHVASGSFDSEEVHAHEAAHGWFGNGVRVACWEDFVLSEGSATYLAGHALKKQGVDIWPKYDCRLKALCDADQAHSPNAVALPDNTCNQIDIFTHPIWSGIPYYKGAHFYRKVAELIGEEQLDRALAEFYGRYHNRDARMQDLLRVIERYAGAKAGDVEALATGWLRSLECPADWETLCPSGP